MLKKKLLSFIFYIILTFIPLGIFSALDSCAVSCNGGALTNGNEWSRCIESDIETAKEFSKEENPSMWNTIGLIFLTPLTILSFLMLRWVTLAERGYFLFCYPFVLILIFICNIWVYWYLKDIAYDVYYYPEIHHFNWYEIEGDFGVFEQIDALKVEASKHAPSSEIIFCLFWLVFPFLSIFFPQKK